MGKRNLAGRETKTVGELQVFVLKVFHEDRISDVLQSQADQTRGSIAFMKSRYRFMEQFVP